MTENATLDHRYFVLNKPYNMVSQFVSSHKVRLLGSLEFDFPPDTHAVGRLDHHSEGLLLLTTDKRVTRLLFSSKKPHSRTYWVQVSGKVEDENLEKMRSGLSIFGRGAVFYTTKNCEAKIIQTPENLFSESKKLHPNVVFTWLSITLTEGKYHQVRKMVAAVGHRCIRLIRVSIEEIMLEDLEPGKVRELSAKEFFEQLDIG